MNYQKIYNSLIEKRKLIAIDGYKESHHIIPKCTGGSNDKENLVYLTASEHYIAHQLLVKIYPENKGLKYACYMMTKSPTGKRSNNKLYGWLKADYMKNRIQSSGMKGRNHSEETKEKLRILKTGSTHTQESKDKISNSKKGVKFSKESLLSFNEKRQNNPNWIASNFRPCKESTKSKIGDANKGRVFEKVICPHCNKEGAGPNMKRYHFDNCKLK